VTSRPAYLLAVLVAVLLVGCASAPQRSAEQQYLLAIEDANRLYETTLTEAGRSHAEGVLTDEQLATVRTAGVKVEQSLRAARASLESWLVLNGNDDGEMDRAMAALQVALTALLEVAHGT
jgi:predicted transposase YdaD